MTEYKVINRFIESNHNGHIYEIGDVYPAKGKKFTKGRAESLTKVHKLYGLVFLKAIEVQKVTKEIEGDSE